MLFGIIVVEVLVIWQTGNVRPIFQKTNSAVNSCSLEMCLASHDTGLCELHFTSLYLLLRSMFVLHSSSVI